MVDTLTSAEVHNHSILADELKSAHQRSITAVLQCVKCKYDLIQKIQDTVLNSLPKGSTLYFQLRTILQTFDTFEKCRSCHLDLILSASVASTPLAFRQLFAFLSDLMSCKYDSLIRCIVRSQHHCATVTRFFLDARVQRVLAPLFEAWSQFAAELGGAVTLEGDTANIPDLTAVASSPAATRANKSISEFVHFIIESVDSSLMKDAINGALAMNGIGLNAVTGGSLRISHFDCALDGEPSEVYCKSHDAFSRSPGLSRSRMMLVMDLFKHYHDENLDVFIAGDSGQTKVRKFMQAAFKKQLPQNKMGCLEMIPRQIDQEVRKHYHCRQSGRLRGKKEHISALSTATGREGFLICHKVGLYARPRKFLAVRFLHHQWPP
jgi:hypothetical protein